jgi:maltose O-acetyltransferase
VAVNHRSRPTRMFWWLGYALIASRIPSWSKAGKKFRVFCAVRFCDDVDPTANINSHAKLPWRLTVHPHGGIGARSVLSGEVVIGPHVTMGPECMFITGGHPVPPDFGKFRDMSPTHSGIVIEEDAFIGARVTILAGVTIGRGAAVGAGTVVAKDVAPGAVVVGNPARVVRVRQV